MPPHILLEDMIQDGMVGLILAFREYRPECGATFRTYASSRIRWSILDGLRANDWAERSVRSGANKIAKAAEKLQGTLGREPSNSEIAEAMGVRAADVLAMLSEAYGYRFISIGDEVAGEVQDIPDYSSEPSVVAERRQAYSRAIASLKLLDVIERRVFILRILCDMSGRQAACELGLSESRISQLVKSATEKIGEGVAFGNLKVMAGEGEGGGAAATPALAPVYGSGRCNAR